MFNAKDSQLIPNVRYSFNKINKIFTITANIAHFGRYYKEKGKKALQNFMEVLSLQLKAFYIFIKNSIIKILMNFQNIFESKS